MILQERASTPLPTDGAYLSRAYLTQFDDMYTCARSSPASHRADGDLPRNTQAHVLSATIRVHHVQNKVVEATFQERTVPTDAARQATEFPHNSEARASRPSLPITPVHQALPTSSKSFDSEHICNNFQIYGWRNKDENKAESGQTAQSTTKVYLNLATRETVRASQMFLTSMREDKPNIDLSSRARAFSIKSGALCAQLRWFETALKCEMIRTDAEGDITKDCASQTRRANGRCLWLRPLGERTSNTC